MVGVADIVWRLGPSARAALQALREGTPEPQYREDTAELKRTLVDYFNASEHCNLALGSSIRALGADRLGRKILKVRWPWRGEGKSHALRLVFCLDCARRRVSMAGVFNRRADPSAADVDAAVQADLSELIPPAPF